MNLSVSWAFLLGVTILNSCVFAHGGRTDAGGGHNDNKHGGYHFHGGGGGYTDPTEQQNSADSVSKSVANNSDVQQPNVSSLPLTNSSSTNAALHLFGGESGKGYGEHISISAQTEEPKSARAREAARKEARKQARLVSRRENSKPVKYKFHHVESYPYEVSEFEEQGNVWKVMLAKGYSVNLVKSDIARIEAIEADDLRTWIDSTGKYSILAKYTEYAEPIVVLDTSDNRTLHVPVGKLSLFDKKHVYYRILHPELEYPPDGEESN